MAFTTDIKHGCSDDLPSLSLRLKTGKEGTVAFYGHEEGNDMSKDKGDLWAFKISNFEFGTCIRKKSDISGVTILNGGSDGWNIESVVTMLHRGHEYDLLTVNMDVKRWIDGNDLPYKLKYDLTFIDI